MDLTNPKFLRSGGLLPGPSGRLGANLPRNRLKCLSSPLDAKTEVSPR